MKEKIFLSPGKYIQGTHVLKHMRKYIKPYGMRWQILISKGNEERLKEELEILADDKTLHVYQEIFENECSFSEIRRVEEVCRQHHAQVLIGIGGGKILDTVKAAADELDLPVAVIPTIASSDAPCSALSVVYKEDGSLDELLHLRSNPQVVLVDLAVICRAPARYLAAGIADALATFYEMQECWKKDADNFVGGRITHAARAIAEVCRDIILNQGEEAYLSVQEKCVTRALEDVTEANILLSGIGFESGGICAAHPINNGIAWLEETKTLLHGEKVAFALICQLILSGEEKQTIRRVIQLFFALGLPVTLQQLHLLKLTQEQLTWISEIAARDPCTKNLPLQADRQAIMDAIRFADALGQAYMAEETKEKSHLFFRTR